MTSLWFFTWQSGNPLEDFGLFLFLYSILVYLPFLYFWFQCSRAVEYETGGGDSTPEIHLSHNVRERTARFILNLSHLAEEEIVGVGQLLPRPAKKETEMFISPLLKGQFGIISSLCLFFFGLSFLCIWEGRCGLCLCLDYYLGPTSSVPSARVRKDSPFQLSALPLNVLSSFIFLSIS